LASSLKLAARCPVSGCWPSFYYKVCRRINAMTNALTGQGINRRFKKLTPLKIALSRPPKGNCVRKNTSYDVEIVKIGAPVFTQLTRLPNPKILYFTMLFNRSDTPKVPLPLGASTPHVIHVSCWTHPTRHPELHIDRFSRFRTAHGRVSLDLTMCVKARLTRDFKK